MISVDFDKISVSLYVFLLLLLSLLEFRQLLMIFWEDDFLIIPVWAVSTNHIID